MPALITGATGFVGSHLAEYLLSRNEKVWGTYYSKNFENIKFIMQKIRLLSCDITKYRQVLQVLKQLKPENIYHLAAFSSVGKSYSQPTEVFRQNYLGTLNLLEAVRQLKLKTRILLAGSAEMYGRVKSINQPIKETQPLNPVSPYGVSKAISEMLAQQYFLNYQIESVRVRAFNHIGPRQSLGFAVPDLVSQIAKIHLRLQKPILKVGNLNARRDFTDVRDIVKGYYLLMQKGKPAQAYNLGSGRAFSIKQIVETLIHFTSPKVVVSQQTSAKRPLDIPLLLGNSNKVRQTTGWKPQIDLSVTLRDTFYFWVDKIGSTPGYVR